MVDYKEVEIVKNGETCVPFAPNKANVTDVYTKKETDTLIATKASKMLLENEVSELENKINQIHKQGDIIYSYSDYERVLDKTIKKVVNEFILDTEGDLYTIDPSGDKYTLFPKYYFKCKDIVDYNGNTCILTEDGELSITDEYLNRIPLANNVKAVKCSKLTMWYLDNDNNLWGKGDNFCNQQLMGKTERQQLQNNRDWENLLYVSDFVKRAENVEDFWCSDFTTWYRYNGDVSNNQYYFYASGIERNPNIGSFTYYDKSYWYQSPVFAWQTGIYKGYKYDHKWSRSSLLKKDGVYIQSNRDIINTMQEIRDYVISNDSFDISSLNISILSRTIFRQDTTSGYAAPIYTEETTDLKILPIVEYPGDTELNEVPDLTASNGYVGVSDTTLKAIKSTTTIELTDDIDDFYVGDSGAWYITSTGALYGLGINDFGQQGSGNTTAVTKFTSRVSDDYVIKVHCDRLNTYYLTLKGDLYGTGYNLNNQLTKYRYYTTDLKYGNTLTKFIKIESNVRDFIITDRYITYWTKNNNVYIKSMNIESDLYKIPTKTENYISGALICDGRAIAGDVAPVKKTTTLYRLLNVETEHYHQDLWTSDINICNKANGDVTKLYRHIRKGNGLGNDVGFCNIKEDISISHGTITSASGFYDGYFVVSTDESIEADNSRIWYDKYQNDTDYPQVCYTGNIENYYAERPVDYINVGGANNIYVGSGTAKISDSRWRVGVASSESLRIGQQTTGAWVQTSLVHTANISSVYNENLFNLELDFVTPAVFTGTPAILYMYRALIIRPINTSGDVNFYMSGYSSSGLKWRHSNISTGMSLKTNTKYHMQLCTIDNKTDNTSLSNYYQYKLEFTAYDKYGNITDDVQTYTFNSNYLPCCYYSNSVTNSISCLFEGETASTGMLLDLDSINISFGQYVKNWTCYQPSFRTGYINNITVLPDLTEDTKYARIHY